jgi:hypothetical protein
MDGRPVVVPTKYPTVPCVSMVKACLNPYSTLRWENDHVVVGSGHSDSRVDEVGACKPHESEL